MIKKGTIIEGEFLSNSNGSAYVVNESLHFDVFIDKKNTEKALHKDKVKVEVIKTKYDFVEGKIINVLERFKDKFVGTLEVNENFAFLIPDSNKIKKDFFIPLDKLNGGKDGQKAVIEMISWEDDKKNPKGFVIEILGEKGDNDAEIHSILHEYNLPYKFDDKVEEEANLIPLFPTEEEISKRKDLRDVLTLGIDPEDSKDADDTISIEWINNDCFVSINIADVSYYVQEGSEIDKEAYKRGNSVYLVDRCIPMLPEKLSNNICSLKSGSDKLAFTVTFKIKNGKVIDKWFGKTIINVNKDYTYEEAQEVIENGIREKFNLTDNAILELNTIAKQLREERVKNNFLSIIKQEIRFKLDENNKPIDVLFKTSKDSNKLIEEFMLLANKEVAKFIKEKSSICINRAHEEPERIKLEELKSFINQFNYTLDITGDSDEIKVELNKLLKNSFNTPEYDMISNLITKIQQKAFYTTKDVSHFGLGFDDYSHFTSPIRRYSDILIHRILCMLIK